MGLAIDSLLAGVLNVVLDAFGVHVGYWVCFGIIILVSFLFSGSAKSANNN